MDTGCEATIIWELCLGRTMTSMDPEDLKIVKKLMVQKEGTYYLGDKQVGAIKSTVIPVNLLGKKVRLLTAVVKGDIPCC